MAISRFRRNCVVVREFPVWIQAKTAELFRDLISRILDSMFALPDPLVFILNSFQNHSKTISDILADLFPVPVNVEIIVV